MRKSDIIRKFASRETLPVQLDEVIAALKEAGHIEEFYFFSAALNTEVLRGFFTLWDYPNDWAYTTDPSGTKTVYVADIYYAESDPPDWQRFVSCKESLHSLDPVDYMTSEQADIAALIEKVTLPPELQNPLKDGPEANMDHAAELQALAVLFPFASRNLLLPHYNSGRITAAEIARMADIPVRYIRTVMSNNWEKVHEILVRNPTQRETS